MSFKKVLYESIAIVILLFLSLTTNQVRGQEELAGTVFELEEFSIFDYQGNIRSQLTSGMSARECVDKPHEKVRAYPAFKSDKPIYGIATFDMSLVPYGLGIDYYFAIDESGGTGKGYDRLYFDINHDFDLTNDEVLEPMKDPPVDISQHLRGNTRMVTFEYLQFDLDYGSDKPMKPLKIIPRFQQISTSKRLSFIYPTARRGKIKIGSKEFEAVLSQNSLITGGYDRPTAGLFLNDAYESIPLLCYWRFVDGKFYMLSATPTGDKLSVKPYKGSFGVFEVAGRDNDAEKGKVELGWLLTKDAVVDIGKCPVENGKLMIPVGDYMPLRLAVRISGLRVGFSMNIPQPGQIPADLPVLGIKIRENEPFVLDLTSEPEVVFRSPVSKERFKAGDEIKVEALVHEPKMDVLISALEDTTKKKGDSIKLPDGTEFENFESIDPMVKITNSSGETVAEGKMPFG